LIIVDYFDIQDIYRIIVRRNSPSLSAADDAGEEDDYEPRHQQNFNIDHISLFFKLPATSFIVKVIPLRSPRITA
jgi:hypothetical protein